MSICGTELDVFAPGCNAKMAGICVIWRLELVQENLMESTNFWLVSAGVDAVRIFDQSQLDRFSGSNLALRSSLGPIPPAIDSQDH